MKKWGLYEWSVILFFFLLPIVAVSIEMMVGDTTVILAEIALKWMVFSGIGLRLGSAGVKQIAQPQFTAKEIFNISDEKALPLVREIGFANISFSLVAIISFIIPVFRMAAAVSGGLYFGLTGLAHIMKEKASGEEKFAMITDLYIFLILLVLSVINIM